MEIAIKIEKFKEKIKEIYPNNFQDIVSDLQKEKQKSFRIIDLENKDAILQSLKDQKFNIKAHVITNAYIVSKAGDKKLSETKEYINSQIYIQELSSMLPVILLNPNPNENILDLCSAPGSKTIQIANLTKNNSNLFAVEKNKFRFFKLKANLNKYNAKVNTILQDGIYLLDKNPGFINYFDKVLVDAPCSSEGKLCFCNTKAFENWNLKRAKIMSKQQKKLISSAIEMLKPGGTLVYSTCTLSVEENEEVLDWVLKQNENIKITKIENKIINSLENAISGFSSFKDKNFNLQVKNSIRIFPTKEFGGFFIAKIEKF